MLAPSGLVASHTNQVSNLGASAPCMSPVILHRSAQTGFGSDELISCNRIRNPRSWDGSLFWKTQKLNSLTGLTLYSEAFFYLLFPIPPPPPPQKRLPSSALSRSNLLCAFTAKQSNLHWRTPRDLRGAPLFFFVFKKKNPFLYWVLRDYTTFETAINTTAFL